MSEENNQAPTLPTLICSHCSADPLPLTLNLASIGPFQVATLFCGTCRKLFHTSIIGSSQTPIVQPVGSLIKGRPS